jgi:hypothetical protein
MWINARSNTAQDRRSAGHGAAVSVTAVDISEEARMNRNKWIRQMHRWLAMTFTVTVVVTFVALAQEEPVVWVSYVPLLPLGLLLLTGLYLFALPYTTKRRRQQSRTQVGSSLA